MNFYQGERALAKNNFLLGQIELDGLLFGNSDIQVNVTQDNNGQLTIEVYEFKTKRDGRLEKNMKE